MAMSDAGIPGGSGSPWLAWFRQLFAGAVLSDRPANRRFVDEILGRLQTGVELDDPAIGKWYATAEAADWGDSRQNDRVGVRFLLSRQPRDTGPIVTSTALQKPQRYDRDLSQPVPTSDNLHLIYNVSSIISISTNIELFKYFSISQIKRLRTNSSAGDPAAVAPPREALPLAGGDPMPSKLEKLAERLSVFAEQLGITATQVVSLKFRPVMPGTKYIDPFGKSDANAYLYTSEYAAGEKAATLTVPAQPLGQAIARTCIDPLTWSNDYQDFISQFQNTEPPVLWVQHETGLEILTAVSSVASIIGVAIQIWEIMRKEIAKNKQVPASDRYNRQVTEVRAEIRYIDHTNRLDQRLIFTQEVTVPISPSMAQMEGWIS